jgi:O-methyltransferase involved in polyketide biosynthesis
LTREGSTLISDPKAVAMVDAIDYDFSRFDGTMSLVGSVLRTRIYDRWIAAWLEANPTGTIVELGSGLNSRYERIDNGHARWYELDLPDVIELRRRFFANTDRRTMLAGSVLDDDWYEPVLATGGPWFLAAEAVLIYLEPEEVTTFFQTIGRRLPSAPVAFDSWGRWMRDHQDDHDAIGQMDARFTWFCDDPSQLAIPDTNLQILERHTFLYAPDEILELLPPPLREMLPAFANDPQMNAYHQNLARVHRR